MPGKVILGLVTAWFVISPFVFFFSWFGFIFSAASQANYNPDEFSSFPLLFIPVFFLIFCSGFLNIGLLAFYFVHVILNKTAGDVIRVVLGLGFIFMPIVALPVYYFIFILSENPPQWALATQ